MSKVAMRSGAERFHNVEFFIYALYTVMMANASSLQGVVKYLEKGIQDLYVFAGNSTSLEEFIKSKVCSSVLDECVKLKFISSINGISLTSVGRNLLLTAIDGNAFGRDKIICHHMEDRYSGLSNLIKGLFKYGKKDGFLILPRPSPKDLGIESDLMFKAEGINEFSNKFEDYANAELHRWTKISVEKGEIRELLKDKLTAKVESSLAHGIKSINFTREVRDVIFGFYLKKMPDLKSDWKSFSLWIDRAKALGLVNSSEFYPGTKGRIIYPVSTISQVSHKGFIKMCNVKGMPEGILKFSPSWTDMKEDFLKCLWEYYLNLSKVGKTFFVSLLDLRDVVCFHLTISEQLFQSFLSRLYKESIHGRSMWDISLEVDKTPSERKFNKSKRYPISIDGLPKNIIGIKMKSL